MSSALIFGFDENRPYPFYLTIDPIEGISDEELYLFAVENLKGLKVVYGTEDPQFFLLDEHGDVLKLEGKWGLTGSFYESSEKDLTIYNVMRLFYKTAKAHYADSRGDVNLIVEVTDFFDN